MMAVIIGVLGLWANANITCHPMQTLFDTSKIAERRLVENYQSLFSETTFITLKKLLVTADPSITVIQDILIYRHRYGFNTKLSEDLSYRLNVLRRNVGMATSVPSRVVISVLVDLKTAYIRGDMQQISYIDFLQFVADSY